MPDWISTKVWSSVVLTWEGHMHTQTVTPRQTLPLEGRQTLFLSIDLSNVAVADLLLICSYFYRAVSKKKRASQVTLAVKNLHANAGDVRDQGFDP